MMKKDRIELNPKVCNGKPLIKGTRIPVSVILEQIAEGISWDKLLANYPKLEKEDIKAAIQINGKPKLKTFKVRKFRLGEEIDIDRDELYSQGG